MTNRKQASALKHFLRPKFSIFGLVITATIALTGLTFIPSSPAVATAPPEHDPLSSALTAPAVPSVNTTTTMSPFVVPNTYGTQLMVIGTVELDAASFISGQKMQLWLDGELSAEGELFYVGSGKFSAFMTTTQLPKAGQYSAVAKFPGYAPTSPGEAGALASESAPFVMNVAPQSTHATVMTAPSREYAFASVNVTAHLQSGNVLPAGTASLMLDSTEIATAPLQNTGDPLVGSQVEFLGARLLGTGGTLWVKYHGSADGNIAPSSSTPASIIIDPLDTSTALAVSPAVMSDDTQLTLEVTVTNETLRSTRDPAGSIEVLIDGTRTQTVVAAQDTDATNEDGVARFLISVNPQGLSAGAHTVAVNYIADPGFVGSNSEQVTFTVPSVPDAPADITPETPSENTAQGAAPATLAQTGYSEIHVGMLSAVALLSVLGAVLLWAPRRGRQHRS